MRTPMRRPTDLYHTIDKFYQCHPTHKDVTTTRESLISSFNICCRKRGLLQRHEFEIKMYNETLYENLTYIYFHPEIQMLIFALLRPELSVKDERKLLLRHQELHDANIDACYPERDTHNEEVYEFFKQLPKNGN